MKISKKDWDWCSMCGPHIKCPKCGNNCCNGSYGYITGRKPYPSNPDDVVCDVCPSAYDYQDHNRKEGKRKFWIRYNWRLFKIKLRRIMIKLGY